MKKKLVIGTVKHTARALGYGLTGGFLVLVVVFVVALERRPDLKVWHEAKLDAEFTASAPVDSLDDYLALEERLFAQLEERVLSRIEPEDESTINRYHRGSLSDPGRWATDWNRTFELSSESPRAGVLLLHGMSDSPYSMRHLGEALHGRGAWVVGLRLPGHGTAPSGLVDVRRKDMAAAVQLAMHHLRDRVGDRPLYIVGYSNGGALAVKYALSALDDTSLPQADGLVLISPAIGVTRMAALAVWQARLGRLLGLDKLAWQSLGPEYDPFKYVSFAVNAGDVTFRLTRDIQKGLDRRAGTGDLERMPRILAFQSAVDGTVSTAALIRGLFQRLPAGGHELVLFDINRVTGIDAILRSDPKEPLQAMLSQPDRAFTLSVVTNRSEDGPAVVDRHDRPGDHETVETDLDLAWPVPLYSLSHIALPFPVDDPLYGRDEARRSPGIRLGALEFRGERGVLKISASDMLRLRWNPFYSHLEDRLLEFVGLADDPASSEP